MIKYIISGLLLINMVWAKKIADTKIPDERLCGGKTLPLQGAGLRTATFLNIKVYVVAYYAADKVKKGEDANSKSRPICYEVTYLRDVDDEDVDKAWKFTFKESSEFPYSALDAHVKLLQDYLGEIKGERKHLFEMVEGKTILHENGKVKGEIPGVEFQKNFFSIWYGKNPPTEEVQEELHQ